MLKLTPTINIDPFVFICHLQTKNGNLRIIENPRLKNFYIEFRKNNMWLSKADFGSLKEAKNYLKNNLIELQL